MAKFNKILLTGINGQVGHALYPKLQAIGEVITLDRSQLDLSNANSIRKLVQHIKPDLIINPAAYTAVDKAESEPELAYSINATAPGVLAEEAAKLGALMVHYSTDYVFDGNKSSPYSEADGTNPLSVYGTSKLAGEQAVSAAGSSHLILRTSWVYGVYGKNFMRTILKLAADRDTLKIVADQFGAPTSSETIANVTVDLLRQRDKHQSGIYHLTNSGLASWFDFAKHIIDQYEALQAENNWPPLKVKSAEILKITTEEFPTPAHRPRNSKLDTNKLTSQFGIEIPNWDQEASRLIKSLTF